MAVARRRAGFSMDSDRPFHISDLRQYALLLDFDGTIVDIAPTPESVEVPLSLRRALARLSERSGGAVALISGRSVADLDRFFAPMRLPIVGVHGAELRLLNGAATEKRDPALLEQRLRRALAALEGAGVVVEDKGSSVALHYRLVPERAGLIRAAVDEICAQTWDPPIEILPGKAVIEIKHAGFSKATGVRELMTHAPFRGRRPVFIGDDTTDETVFPILPELGGFGFSVGREIAGLTGHFDAPADVRAWLDQLAPADESVAP
jgi:trehalose 6-phosphate phosphatase